MRKQKCKCYNCSQEGFNTEFIQVKTITNTNAYFCSEGCKEYVLNNKKLEFDIFYLIIDLMGEHIPKSSASYLKNQLKTKSDEDLEMTKDFLIKNEQILALWLGKKEFMNKTIKLKYILSILENAVEKEKRWKEIQEKRWKEESSQEVEFNDSDLTKSFIKNNMDISKWL